MPGLRLTAGQVERLCGVERGLCASVLETLVNEKFLCANTDGTFARLTDGGLARPLPAKAELPPPSRDRRAS